MGLRCTNRYVASLIDTMVVITAINDSTTRIRRGQADAALLRWFGDSSPAWKQTALQRLEQLRRIINLQEISIGVSRLADRDITGGVVDTGVYDPQVSNNQSQFETVIHELTHVILSTNDEKLANNDDAYGTNRALQLAGQNMALAKTNAENWGCFIEACGKFKGS